MCISDRRYLTGETEETNPDAYFQPEKMMRNRCSFINYGNIFKKTLHIY